MKSKNILVFESAINENMKAKEKRDKKINNKKFFFYYFRYKKIVRKILRVMENKKSFMNIIFLNDDFGKRVIMDLELDFKRYYGVTYNFSYSNSPRWGYGICWRKQTEGNGQ